MFDHILNMLMSSFIYVSKKDAEQIERVQRHATKLVPRLCNMSRKPFEGYESTMPGVPQIQR